jgi:hypothetical protein
MAFTSYRRTTWLTDIPRTGVCSQIIRFSWSDQTRRFRRLVKKPPRWCPSSCSGHYPLRSTPGRAVRPDAFLFAVMIQHQTDGWRVSPPPPDRPSLGQRPGLQGTQPAVPRPSSALLSIRRTRMWSRSAPVASYAPVQARPIVRCGPGASMNGHGQGRDKCSAAA